MNEEIQNILIKHHKLYPKMEIDDVIKLIFQSVLGPRHLLIDESKSLLWIKDEAMHNPNQKEEYTDIGNNYVRVNLINDDEYLKKINKAFIKSCEINNNNLYKILLELTDFIIDEFSFNKNDYINRINELNKLGFIAVSHSKTYNDTYHPFYRVINKKYL